MQIRVSPRARQRGNMLVGIFVLVVGAVIAWKLYVTAKHLLPDDPAPAPPPQASNNIPTNLPPNVTVNANYWEAQTTNDASVLPQTVLVVYGLEHTQYTSGGYLTGQPMPVVPAISLGGQSAGGSVSQWLTNVASYGLSPDIHSTWLNGGHWYAASGPEFAGLMTVPALWGVDVGGPYANGFYLTTLQKATATGWTNVTSPQWMHGGTFAFYLDTSGDPSGFYRAVMDDGQPTPVVVTNGGVR